MLEAEPNRRRRLPDTLISELCVFLYLLPLLYVDLSRPLSSWVYASDANKKAAEIAYAELSACDIWSFKENVADTRFRKR